MYNRNCDSSGCVCCILNVGLLNCIKIRNGQQNSEMASVLECEIQLFLLVTKKCIDNYKGWIFF